MEEQQHDKDSDTSSVPVLLISANVGSVFEDVSPILFLPYVVVLSFLYFRCLWGCESLV